MADTRCPHCDHVFAVEEITEEWCAQCGKHIPEMLLKEVRPKPHLRNPHPHPLPSPTPAAQAASARETQVRVAGLLIMLSAVVLGLGCLAWGAYTRMSSGAIGTSAWVGGSIAAVGFVIGAVMLTRGQTGED